jgi:cell division protein FtsQ
VPYTEEVVVKRLWPDTLVITLVEQKLVAKWGEDEAVTSKGEVVHASLDSREKIPEFLGPEGQSKMMLEQYNDMIALLQPLHLVVIGLNLNSRRSWQITLNNGMKIILGRKEVATRLHYLTAVFPKLKQRHGSNIESIDLRHPNGVCVRLKTTPTLNNPSSDVAK